ncbi:MAG: RND transporter MFP subunit [Saprospiraceae bacterium]|nr:MAG: RND transporter MFP subunit [Saprospiraceae bacterium]
MNKGCLFSFIGFLVLSAIGLVYYFSQQGDKTAANFETEKPVLTDIIKKTVATGSIKPRHEVQIKPQVSGVVEELYVEEGQMVTKGQKLAKIRLVPSEVNINSAKSNVELSRLRVQEAQRELTRQQGLNKRNLDVESARVNYENAVQEAERQEGLFKDGVISEQEYNRFKVDLELRKAEYENAKVSSTNSLKQFETELEIRQQEFQAATNNLALLREGASRNSKQVANIVVSTLDGMVLDLPAEEGTSVIERNNFNEGTSIAIVADMNALIFEGKVDESDVGKLKEGMPLELTVGAIEDKKFPAILEFVSPKGIDEDGTVKFEIKAAIQQTKDIFLRAGYSANGDIILDQVKQVIAIKERDVIFEEDTTFVEVEVAEREFEKRKVKLGLSDGILVEVAEGLDTTSKVRVIAEAVD